MKRIIKRNKILYSNSKELEEYLSTMAAKGYILERFIFADYFVFKKDEPRNIRYYVDYYEAVDSNDMELYCASHKRNGLNKIASSYSMHIFEGVTEDSYLEFKADVKRLVQKNRLLKLYSVVRSLLGFSFMLYLTMLIDEIRSNKDAGIITYMSACLGIIAVLYIIKNIEYGKNKKAINNKVKGRVLVTNTEVVIFLIFLPFIFILGIGIVFDFILSR